MRHPQRSPLFPRPTLFRSLPVAHRHLLPPGGTVAAGGDVPDLPLSGEELVLVLSRLGSGLHDLPEGGHVPDGVDLVARSSGDLAIEGEPNPALLQAPLLNPKEGFAADEVTLVEPDPTVEAHVEGRVFLAYVRTVEGQGLLDPQRLHGLHTICPQLELPAGLEDVLPEFSRLVRRDV